MSQQVSTSARESTPQDLFSKVAPFYDRLNAIASLGRERHWRRAALEKVATTEPLQVLDLCCGTGAMAEAITRACPRAEITGTDMNEQMLEQAHRKRARQYAQLSLGSATAVNAPDGSFDLVVMGFCFHDLLQPDEVLQEVSRLLRPGGRLVCLELTLPDHATTRKAYVGLLTALAATRNALGLRRLGHLIDEVLAAPPHDYLMQKAQEAGFSWLGNTSHGGGAATSYRFAATGPSPVARTDPRRRVIA